MPNGAASEDAGSSISNTANVEVSRSIPPLRPTSYSLLPVTVVDCVAATTGK